MFSHDYQAFIFRRRDTKRHRIGLTARKATKPNHQNTNSFHRDHEILSLFLTYETAQFLKAANRPKILIPLMLNGFQSESSQYLPYPSA